MVQNLFVRNENSDFHCVAGRLARFIPYWEKLQAPDIILNIIKGYKIPFGQKPPLRLPKTVNKKLVTVTSPQMNDAMNEMISTGVLESAQLSPSFISPMFLTPKSDGSMRPIFNLRNLNEFLVISKFRLINMHRIPDFLQPFDWLVKIDISKAYFHIPIAAKHRRFLRLVYKNRLLQMTCLPFGLATAPKVFATLTNWIAQTLRNKGIRIVTYLDDYLISNQDRKILLLQVQETISLLESLGWQINYAKSILNPQKCLEFLGICWDPWSNLKYLPLIKCQSLSNKILPLLMRKTASLKEIQSLVGLINFASFTVTRGRLNHRNLLKFQKLLLQLDSSHRFAVPELALMELEWWLKNHETPSSLHNPPTKHFLTTDASEKAWGACLNNKEISGLWLPQERHFHSNIKEMLAVYHAIEQQSLFLKNTTVMLQSDNKTVVSYIRKEGGSKSTQLMHLTRALLTLLDNLQIHLVAHYIPAR